MDIESYVSFCQSWCLFLSKIALLSLPVVSWTCEKEGGDSHPLWDPYLEHCIQLCGIQPKKDMHLLEQIQGRATEVIRVMEHLS